jgi:hypothetical protein
MIHQDLKDKLKFDLCAVRDSSPYYEAQMTGARIEGARYQHEQSVAAIELLLKTIEVQHEALALALNEVGTSNLTYKICKILQTEVAKMLAKQ